MPSQREIRRRIGAVRNIKQITRAMQFVAASKMKRAQDAALATRPYREKIDEIVADVASVLSPDAIEQVASMGVEFHAMLGGRTEGRRLIVLVTTDRGLAGPLNTNVIRYAMREILETSGDVALVTVGRKGRDAMRRAGVPIVASFPGFGDRPSFADVNPLAVLLNEEYMAGGTREIDIIYPRYISTLVQRPTLERLVPVATPEDSAGIPGGQFIFEPNPLLVFEAIIPRWLATRLYQVILEAKASEESSRMVAMKSATENAEELIEDLTLSYNKVRQANITREMIEIATGARAT
jgi:F-type H+-transporting ATPase subunit gamma